LRVPQINTRRQFRQVANSLTRRANKPPRVQRRRSDTGGGLAPTQIMPRPVEMPEANFEDAEFFCETLDCMNPWYEPGSYFYYDDAFNVPDQTDVSLHLQL
jgi:hypothetical protein